MVGRKKERWWEERGREMVRRKRKRDGEKKEKERW